MIPQNNFSKQKGTALVSVLFVAIVVAGLSTAYVLRSVYSSRATRFDLVGEEALHLAEAGLDLAIVELVSIEDGVDNDGDMCVDEADESDGVVSGQLGRGTFSVQSQLIQAGLYRLISTAEVDGIFREIEATVVLPISGIIDPPAALTIINDEGETGIDVNFSGNAFTVSGHDTNFNGAAGNELSVGGIAVFDDDSALDIINSLNNNGVQDDDIAGAASVPSVANVSSTCDIDLQKVNQFVQRMDLCADLRFVRIDDDGYPVIVEEDIELGTDGDPKVTYVEGSLELRGDSSGAGILVVNGDLRLRGDFHFHGLVVVTGTSHFLGADARGNTKIHGAVIIANPAGLSGDENLDLRGNVDIWYSSEGLSLAEQAMGDQSAPMVISWRRTR